MSMCVSVYVFHSVSVCFCACLCLPMHVCMYVCKSLDTSVQELLIQPHLFVLLIVGIEVLVVNTIFKDKNVNVSLFES